MGYVSDLDGHYANIENRAQTPTGMALNVQIGPGDPISNIPVVIEFDHHQIHEGETYTYEYYSTSISSIKFSFSVPNGYTNSIHAPHLIVAAEIYEGAGMVSIFEGPTLTGAGTAGTIYNRNRNVAMNAQATVGVGVTTSADGTRLPGTFILGGGGVSSRSAVAGRGVSDLITKPNTVYLVSFEEITAVTRLVLSLEWYEDLGV